MVQGLRALAVPPQDPSLVAKPHTGRLKSTFNSSSRGSSCSLQTGMDTYTHVHKSTYRYKKGMKKSKNLFPGALSKSLPCKQEFWQHMILVSAAAQMDCAEKQSTGKHWISDLT